MLVLCASSWWLGAVLHFCLFNSNIPRLSREFLIFGDNSSRGCWSLEVRWGVTICSYHTRLQKICVFLWIGQRECLWLQQTISVMLQAMVLNWYFRYTKKIYGEEGGGININRMAPSAPSQALQRSGLEGYTIKLYVLDFADRSAQLFLV